MTDAVHHDACLLSDRFPLRATSWRLRTRQLHFTRVPALMGIINVTPDSFSDGGKFADAQRAIAHGLRLAEEGASILDVGGESTRPFADSIDAAAELKRVMPVIQTLAESTTVAISVDTSKAEVAREAIAAGAEIINDVSGCRDPALVEVARETGAGVCVMHMHGTPQTMQVAPDSHYANVVEEVLNYLKSRQAMLVAQGIDPQNICVDPGIGFGKTHQHNVDLIASIARFHELECPLLVGHSRKGFLAKILGDKELDRAHANQGVSLALAASGVQVLRVHDVLATRQALLSFAAVGGIDGQTLEFNP